MYNNSQHTFKTHDQTELFYQHWESISQKNSPNANKKAIILFHRGHEHSDRMAHLVDELKLTDFDFFAWDEGGHGDEPGARADPARRCRRHLGARLRRAGRARLNRRTEPA